MKKLHDFFTDLFQKEWTGEVDIFSSQAHATLAIKKGRLVFAYRPFTRAFERIAAFPSIQLPPSEIISNVQTWQDFIRSVIRENKLKESLTKLFLDLDQKELFFRIFLWSNVELSFREVNVSIPQSLDFDFLNPCPLNSLLSEATKRLSEWPKIKEQMGSSHRIFTSHIIITPDASSEMFVGDKIEESFSTASSVAIESVRSQTTNLKEDLSLEELAILPLCNGQNTLYEIVHLSPYGEYLTLQAILSLWKKKAVSPRGGEEKENLFSWTRIQWADLKLTFLSFLLISLIFIFNGIADVFFQTKLLPQERVTQSLEIYRAAEGVYPLTLRVLVRENLITQTEAETFDYFLLHPTRYHLSSKRRL